MSCPYCEEGRPVSRKSAKSCGSLPCKKAHNRTIKRLQRQKRPRAEKSNSAPLKMARLSESSTVINSLQDLTSTYETKQVSSHLSELRTTRDLDTGEVKRVHTEVNRAVQSETQTLQIKEKITSLQKAVAGRRQELLMKARKRFPPNLVPLEVYKRLLRGMEESTGYNHDKLFEQHLEHAEAQRYSVHLPSSSTPFSSPPPPPPLSREEQAALDNFERLRSDYTYCLNNPLQLEAVAQDNEVAREVLRICGGQEEELLSIPGVMQWLEEPFPEILTSDSPGFPGPGFPSADGGMFSDHVGIMAAHLPRKIDYYQIAHSLRGSGAVEGGDEELTRLLQARVAASRAASAPGIRSAEEVTAVLDSFLETLATRLRVGLQRRDVMAAGGPDLLCGLWRNCERIRDACSPHFDSVRFEGGRVRVKTCPCTLVQQLDGMVGRKWRGVEGFEDFDELAALVDARWEWTEGLKRLNRWG